jgi:hypothetical protein
MGRESKYIFIYMLITESQYTVCFKNIYKSLKQIIEQIIGMRIKWLVLRLDILNIFILYSINFIQS